MKTLRISLITLCLLSTPAWGQDLSAQLAEVQKLIEEKDYVTALEDLKFIAQQIQEFRLAEVSPLFPSAPEGWRAEPPVRTSREGEFWSRRLQVQRRYAPEDLTAKVEIIYDFNSPLVPRIALSLNPVYLSADSRTEGVKISGHQGRIWFNGDTGEGEILVLVDGRVLVSVVGRGISSRETLRTFADRIEFATLASFMPP